MLWYSLEAPRRGASNEYPQQAFSWRNKKDISIFRMKKAPYLLLCYFKKESIRCPHLISEGRQNYVLKEQSIQAYPIPLN